MMLDNDYSDIDGSFFNLNLCETNNNDNSFDNFLDLNFKNNILQNDPIFEQRLMNNDNFFSDKKSSSIKSFSNQIFSSFSLKDINDIHTSLNFNDNKDIDKDIKKPKIIEVKNDFLSRKRIIHFNIIHSNNDNKELKENKNLEEKNNYNIEKELPISMNEVNSTNSKSDNNIKSSNEKNIINIQYRKDYYIKAFKVNCFKYLTKIINELISKSNLPQNLKKKKIYKPNNKSFTSNTNEKDNYEFLKMSLKEIFCYIKKGQTKNINLQKKNKELIDSIFYYFEKNKEIENLISFLNITMEEHIIEFYKSEEFIKFKKEAKIQFFEKEFYKEKKFYILENYGFIKMLKMYMD